MSFCVHFAKFLEFLKKIFETKNVTVTCTLQKIWLFRSQKAKTLNSCLAAYTMWIVIYPSVCLFQTQLSTVKNEKCNKTQKKKIKMRILKNTESTDTRLHDENHSTISLLQFSALFPDYGTVFVLCL